MATLLGVMLTVAVLTLLIVPALRQSYESSDTALIEKVPASYCLECGQKRGVFYRSCSHGGKESTRRP